MSLVTTAMSSVARIFLHSRSTSAVLPEPTGPPTPTRKGPRIVISHSPRQQRHQTGRQNHAERRIELHVPRGERPRPEARPPARTIAGRAAHEKDRSDDDTDHDHG